ncbi:hypothetical protein [Sulfobacillus sp. hq2]|uniref:CcmD family protein n=1 Tax=Sulfobacillus thermotolerans TaxID=338644 RepID=A0ABN5GXC9_9FIRM|nr:hypothetical protein [Sulfobacillus sp. hq2]AUW93165.1 hypothetical protein BXT84_03700 [Sulfobacillus thermotolerans]POB11803.1 hypothetical protein CO251_03090 [Sulfobacillus sp. hq2]
MRGEKNTAMTATTWVVVLLAVDGAVLLAVFALLSRIEQRLTQLENKFKRPTGRKRKEASPHKEK